MPYSPDHLLMDSSAQCPVVSLKADAVMAVQPTASKAAASQPPSFFFIIAPFSVILRRSLSKKHHSSWRAVVLCRPTGQSYQKGRERSRQAAQFIQEKFGYSAAALISKIAALFHRDALGKVPGLINVAAALERHIIGEQLQRHYAQRRLHYRVRRGHCHRSISGAPGP